MPVEHYQKVFRSFMDTIIAYFVHKRSPDGQVSQTNPLEQYVCIIETEGAGWKNASLAFLRMLVQETNVYYPDRLQEVIVLGVSTTIKAIWRVASPVVHPRTRKKVRLLSHSEIRPAMQKLVAAEVLPSIYGGRAPPSPNGTIEASIGALAAATWKRLDFGLCSQAATEEREAKERKRQLQASSRASSWWSCCSGRE